MSLERQDYVALMGAPGSKEQKARDVFELAQQVPVEEVPMLFLVCGGQDGGVDQTHAFRRCWPNAAYLMNTAKSLLVGTNGKSGTRKSPCFWTNLKSWTLLNRSGNRPQNGTIVRQNPPI
jgi:hypothetical protein